MRAKFLFFAAFSVQLISFAQKSVEPTNSFTVFGQVDKPLTVTFADLKKEKQVQLDSFKIFNPQGEFRRQYKTIKGVRLLDVLKNVTIASPDPKTLNEFYLIAKASDGYSVVISWNELFNSAIGSSFLLVLEADNKPQQDGAERILLIATQDLITGRRHVKGLASIEIKRI